MRKKGKKVIRPAGDELMDYLNRGFAICNRCGAVMDQREDPRGGCDIYACPSCGWEIDEMEYEIGILKDEKAESVMKNHTMQCFDCLERLGYPIEKFLKEQEKES